MPGVVKHQGVGLWAEQHTLLAVVFGTV